MKKGKGRRSRFTAVRLTDTEREQIERMARANGTTLSNVMRSLFDVGFQAANNESGALMLSQQAPLSVASIQTVP